MEDLVIRRFQPGDGAPVSDMIAETLRVTNSADYSQREIDELIAHMTAEDIEKRAGWTHFYVALAGGAVAGCGAIGPYWGKLDESSFFTIFVRPACQGRGVGRRIVETLERDEYFLRARRVEIPASITAVNFYRKLGYDYKNGVAEIDEERLYRLEKIRERAY
ncbi:MAG: GNAT family N-acetyltransferase [Clostridia bacterium]|nr:GNAT family N-acetyltransferase [Clostridia bacterium]